MKFTGHLKTAIIAGFLIGLIIGAIDIISRIFILSFEWFELYQTMLISTILITTSFMILGLFAESARKIIGFKAAKKDYYAFYLASGIAALMLFYSGIILNRYIFSKIVFWNPISLAANFVAVLSIIIIYLYILTRGKEPMYNAISYLQKKGAKKIINNIAFTAVIFIVVSLIADLFLLYNDSGFKSRLSSEGNPNLIIVQLEGVRPDHLSLYGYNFNTTPNIDRLGANSVVFESAISAGTFTIPSVSSMFTGKYLSGHKASAAHHRLNFEEVTLAEILREQGYNTAGFVGSVFLKRKFGMGQGFITHRDRIDFFEWKQTFEKFGLREALVTFFPIAKSLFKFDGERTAEETNQFIFRWLDKNKNRPFFMFINYEDTDRVLNLESLGEEFRVRFISNPEEINYKEVKKTYFSLKRYGNASEDIISDMVRLYDTKLFYIDYHLGKLFDKLDELGLKDNTIIIITSDHGVEFYEHGGFDHGETMYEEAIHVPLIMFYHGEFEPRRIEQRIDQTDIFPTVLEALELEVPENIDGQSLLPLIKNERNYSKDYTMTQHFGQEAHETQQQIAIASKDWKLIEVKPDNIETLPSSLFNLRTDPKEQKNLYYVYHDKREMLRGHILNITRGSVQLD